MTLAEYHDIIIHNSLMSPNKNFQTKTEAIYLLLKQAFLYYLIICLSFSAKNENMYFCLEKPPTFLFWKHENKQENKFCNNKFYLP